MAMPKAGFSVVFPNGYVLAGDKKREFSGKPAHHSN